MAVTVNANERSWAIQLIQEISAYVKGKPDFTIKRAGGETTINTGKQRMFPDVLLFGDENQSLILQGWELKMPDVPIDNADFIKDSWRKAENLGLTSTVIWNFRYAVFYVKNSGTGKFEIAREWNNSALISERRDDVTLHKSEWLKTLFEVVDEVNRYFSLGTFKPLRSGETFINSASEAFIMQNKNVAAKHLKEKSKQDSILANFIDLWWDGASGEYIQDEKDAYAAYAKVILLDWMNKITFAHIIRSRFATAERVTEIAEGTTPQDALRIFEEITAKCDFFSVFRKVEYQEHLPEIVWAQLLEINAFLCETRLDTIEQADMQSLLENSVRVSQRVIIGQYTTDYRLADFLVRIAMKKADGYCLDPCCGTGSFARAFMNCKREKDIAAADVYKTVFASDRQSFPLQIAGLATVSKESVNLPAIVFQKNVFDLNVGDTIQITSPTNGERVNITVPQFDTIVSNLPFIDFCRNNTHDKSDASAKSKICADVSAKTNIRISDRSDYYMYIVLHLWTLLKTGGTACVLTSNSWMATAAGVLFINALSRYFTIKGIVKSGNGRWFQNAEIVTTAFILERKEISSPALADKISFCLLKASLAELENRSVLNKAVGTVLQNREIDCAVMTRQEYSWQELEEIKKLNLSFNAGFHNVKWLMRSKTNLIPLGALFRVFRGAKTGQDSIFIPSSPDAVDAPYVSRMLKNTKGCDTLIAEPDNYFVTSDRTYEEMEALGHTKTIRYFRQFEETLNPSVLQHGDIWYNLKEAKKKFTLITSLNPDKRLFFAKFNEPTCINQRLIGFIPKDKDLDIGICHALLNSVIGMFYIEATGFGRGAGALDLSKDKVADSFMLNPNLLSDRQRQDIIAAFEPLLNRNILPVEQELEQADRQAFDAAVLRAYGMEGLYDEIKDTLLSMMRVRLGARE
ncbi:MAG: N-6 DNA methylase [Treponema sp.]|nr:N-6 DNA methylase [Treponema sp.]